MGLILLPISSRVKSLREKMYADRMEGGARRPVKERLNNGNGVIGSTRQQQQRQITGKRFAISLLRVFMMIFNVLGK